MRFFADENVPHAIIAWLRSNGHDVLHAAEELPGRPDADVRRGANDTHRVIFTAERDFAEWIVDFGEACPGVVLLRLADLTVAERIARLEDAWPDHQANPAGILIDITKDKIQVRPLVPDDQTAKPDSR